MQENYKIQACLFKLLGSKAGHCFLRLLDSQGNVLEELQGLATSKSGDIKPVGFMPTDTLKAYCFTGVYLKADIAEIVFEGVDTIKRWQVAKNFIEKINESNISYPIFGFLTTKVLLNSNSVFSTFLKIMGLPIPDFTGFFTPGKENLLPIDREDTLVIFLFIKQFIKRNNTIYHF